MKKQTTSKFLVTLTLLGSVLTLSAQNTFPDPGNVGIGITSPNSNLHIHGTSDYIVSTRFGGSVNYGITSRILLTSTTSGSATSDGMELRFSELNGIIQNMEGKNLTLSSGGVGLTLDGVNARINAGTNAANNTFYGKFNIQTSTDNGLYVRTVAADKYALKLQVANTTTNAIEIVNSSNTSENNFTVNGGGQVYARKYTTTLSNIPDYVFDESYELMTIEELKEYVEINNHLPNVPSAKECEENGVDLGELNRILLEKVEELSLYIIQLNEEVQLLKENTYLNK